jgi:hypothetical protein
VHLGIEEILREKSATPRDHSPRLSLHLHRPSLNDVLVALCNVDPRYTWSKDGATINVYPKSRASDPADFLNSQIERIRVADVPDPGQALTPLSQLFPGVVGYMQTGGDITYAAPWTATFERLSVRQFINRIAEHMGPSGSWFWQGGRDAQFFTFVRGGFNTH